MNGLFFRRRVDLALLLVVLLVALLLRVYGLDDIPPGLHYDEAANAILAANIAEGETHPLFIEAYTGKEVLFFYLAGASMRLLGASVFSLRLTSALIGVLTVEIVVKPDAPPGQCVIELGMYLPQSGQRLPVLDEAGQVQGDRVLLDTVEIQY